MKKEDWHLVLLALVIFTTVSANELGYGVIALAPGLLLGCWLMLKVFPNHK